MGVMSLSGKEGDNGLVGFRVGRKKAMKIRAKVRTERNNIWCIRDLYYKGEDDFRLRTNLVGRNVILKRMYSAGPITS